MAIKIIATVVDRGISERCLGHIIGAVRGTYNRRDYLTEKREAFEKLAALVAQVVNWPQNSVVVLRAGRARQRPAPAK